MTLWTSSRGLLARRRQVAACLGQPLALFDPTVLRVLSAGDGLVGWGQKANTRQIKQQAHALGLPYWQLEDGFIGYVGHPAKGGHALSLIADPVGIYYDARQPSRLEQLITTPCDNALLTRAERLMADLVRFGITKYNCYASSEAHHGGNGGVWSPQASPERVVKLMPPAGLHHAVGLHHTVGLHHAAGLMPSAGQAGQTKPQGVIGRLLADPRPRVLLVDQVAGDLSIPGALASEADFLAMVAAARRAHPTARLLLRTHPDTGVSLPWRRRKRGVLARLAARDPALADLEIISEPCHPHALIGLASAVYTVSSQLGFEALLLGKPVHCFGMPFYAGWGLTHDSKRCERRAQAVMQLAAQSAGQRQGTDQQSACVAPSALTVTGQGISLPQLVAAALIRYPRYLDPVLGQRCEVEEVVALLARQQQPPARWRRLYLVGFSLWKRAFMATFCRHLADELRFVRRPPTRLTGDEQVLVWGSRYPELTSALRVEDGFIRSNGLGSNLCRPSSLCLDPVGIYFDARRPSGLEQQLNYQPLAEPLLRRGERLIALLRQHRISKYNLGQGPDGATELAWPAGRERVLVVGQVDGDASIVCGSPVIGSNEQLLWAVRAAKPDAHILFKPHPDVVAGNRAGAISAQCLRECVDSEVHGGDLASLYPQIDELHTMTSLSGFEALVQGVKVITWGQPFYSGWGLTHDMHPPARRQRPLPLAGLVYLTLAAYPRYLDWQSGLWCSPEQLISQLATAQPASVVAASRWQRWWRKAGFLAETLQRAHSPLS